MGYSPPGSSVHGILQARIWCGLPFPPPGDLPSPQIEPLLHWQEESLPLTQLENPECQLVFVFLIPLLKIQTPKGEQPGGLACLTSHPLGWRRRLALRSPTWLRLVGKKFLQRRHLERRVSARQKTAVYNLPWYP